MKATLPRPPSRYDERYQSELNGQLERLLDQKFHRGERVEAGAAGVVLTAPDGSRWLLTVSNAGVLGTTAL